MKGFSFVGTIILILILAVLGAGGWYFWQQQQNRTAQNNPQSNTQQSNDNANNQAVNFQNPKKGAHFQTSTPAHGATLAAVPVDVVIDFDFDLADNSTISIQKDGKEYSAGTTAVDANKLAMHRQMDANAPDGIYTVNYNGCWPDRSCHDGHFQFRVDSTALNGYEDLRTQKAITVKMSQIKFAPKDIRISSGTTVTWQNDDTVDHYINTDSHPAHSQVPSFNSKALAQGESYSFTFTDRGAYPYHCSAHAANMTGNIVVE